VSAVGLLIGYGLLIGLPVVAELVALVKVACLRGWKDLLWAVLIIPFVASVACNIWSYAMTKD
jgi:hypothetical protein